MHPTADAWKFTITRQMFLDTADENYVSARVAFFEDRDRDFWWLLTHSLEKYLKAILLMNGVNPRPYDHDPAPLLSCLKALDARLVPPPFSRPPGLGIERVFDLANKNFIEGLRVHGHPNSRYGTYSYVISAVDIFQADHLIYWARRHARLLRQRLSDGKEVDWIAELQSNPSLWRHHSGAPLEKLADLGARNPRRRSLTRLNLAFFPNMRHRGRLRGGIAHNAPIYLRVRALERSAAGSEERLVEREVLEWILENIRMSKDDRVAIQTALHSNP